MPGSFTLLTYLFAAGLLSAADVSVGVFSLFRPDAVTIRNACGAVGAMAIRDRDYKCDETSSFELEIPGRIRRDFRGRIRIEMHHSIVTPVVSMDLETAVASVIAAEMPADTPEEALKALAIVVRSFYLTAGRRHQGYDFCDTTHCQFLRAPPGEDHPAWRVVRDTAGMVLTWNGRAFPAMHCASCGGRTFRAEEIGFSADAGYPYFNVTCEACVRVAPAWTRTLRHDDAVALLQPRSEKARLAFVRKYGWNALPSNNYRVIRGPDQVVFEGKGAGHGVGLCQRGAASLAAQGVTFREILRHYFPHTELRTALNVSLIVVDTIATSGD